MDTKYSCALQDHKKVGICVEKENREVFRKIQFQASQYKNE